MIRQPFPLLACAVLAAVIAAPAAAQYRGITLPPDGGNQRQTVIQQIGMVRVSIDYSSPHVHSPSGEDRKGKIWGQLVPYGLSREVFGTCGDQCPWRGGANENTVFTTSHDIKVQGQPLPAGAYGLHFIPGPEEWTVIFSKSSTSWGSFFYDAKEDALRVKARPEPAEYHEVLAYEFPERRIDTATLALQWESLAVPVTLTVDNPYDLYVDQIRQELRSTGGFGWQGWLEASQFCREHKIHLAEALQWAQRAVAPPVGQENFATLSNLARLQEANGQAAEAARTMDKALDHYTAGPLELHQLGRQLLAEKNPQEAMKVFEINARRHPDVWPVHVGLARGHAALGRKEEALAEARLTLPSAPNEASRKNLESMIQRISEGKPVD